MQKENLNPIHNHYMLIDKHTMKPFEITLHNRTYMFLVNRQYFLNPKKDFFSLKEKLYILNLPYDIVWTQISITAYLLMNIFLNCISPSSLKLDISNGKVTPYISRKEGF